MVRGVTSVVVALLMLSLPAAADAVTFTGQLGRSHAHGVRVSDRTFWSLQAGPRLVRLRMETSAPIGLIGRHVRATGTMRRGALVIRRGGLRVLPSAPRARSAAAGTLRTAIILVRFNDQTQSLYTPAQAKQVVFGSDQYSVDSYFHQQSYGGIDFAGATDQAGDAYGPYLVDEPSGTGTCNATSSWAQAASTAASGDGFSFGDYDRVVYMFSTHRCGWGGLGQQPGSVAYINTTGPYVIAHELGHTFGAPHASSLRCHDGGVAVTLSATCDPPDEYGDLFDPMGSGGVILQSQSNAFIPTEMEPFRKRHMGVMTADDMPTITTSGTYTISPLETASGVRGLRLPSGRPGRTMFDLSVRAPMGDFDSLYATPDTGNPRALDGVVVTMSTSAISGENTWLLDMTPETAGGDVDPYTHRTHTGFEDAPLAVGKTFHDQYTGLTLTTEAIDLAGARVKVEFGAGDVDVASPSTPDAPTASADDAGTVTLSWAPATDAVGVVSYDVLRDGAGWTSVETSTTDQPGPGVHSYAVRARDAAGNVSSYSAATSVTVTAGATTTTAPGRTATVPPTVAPGCKVPALRNRTLASAKQALARAGCRIGKVRRARSRTIQRRRVMSQRPVAGRVGPAGARVDVTLSRGRR